MVVFVEEEGRRYTLIVGGERTSGILMVRITNETSKYDLGMVENNKGLSTHKNLRPSTVLRVVFLDWILLYGMYR